MRGRAFIAMTSILTAAGWLVAATGARLHAVSGQKAADKRMSSMSKISFGFMEIFQVSGGLRSFR